MLLLGRAAAVVFAIAPLFTQAAPISETGPSPTKWIIQLKPKLDIAEIVSHKNKVREIHARSVASASVDATASNRRDITLSALGGIEKEFDFGDFKGYAGSFDAATIAELNELDEVLLVEEDGIMTTMDVDTEADASYDLVGISSRTNGSGIGYTYDDRAGEGFFNYIVDTGIRLTHTQFGGRAVWGFNAVNTLDTDNNGHGTHVTGIAIGTTYGVAKKSTAVAVKVFETGSGSTSTVIAGFNWAVNDIVAQNRTDTAVINMSLAGAGSAMWDAAITAAYNQGVLAVVAAGNENRDASLDSPARSPEAVTVGNVAKNNIRYQGSVGSNYGTAVDIWAGGVQIVSSFFTTDTATAILTGTSMATPHVTGLVSYLRSVYGPLPAEDVKTLLYSFATTGLVQDGQGAADRLANNGIEDSTQSTNETVPSANATLRAVRRLPVSMKVA